MKKWGIVRRCQRSTIGEVLEVVIEERFLTQGKPDSRKINPFTPTMAGGRSPKDPLCALGKTAQGEGLPIMALLDHRIGVCARAGSDKNAGVG